MSFLSDIPPHLYRTGITVVTWPARQITKRLSIEKIRSAEVSHLSLTITNIQQDECCGYDELLAILDAFPALERLSMNSDLMDGSFPKVEIPSHILTKLKYLSFSHELPVPLQVHWENAQQLEDFLLDIPVSSPGFEQLLAALPGMQKLRYFLLPKTNDLEIWCKLLKVPALEVLDLRSYTVLPAPLPVMMQLLKPLTHLKEIIRFFPKKNEELTEAFLPLDTLDKLELSPAFFKDSTNLPVVLSRLTHVHLYNESRRNQATYNLVNTFITRYATQPLTDAQREMLFLCWTKSWHRVRKINRNHLLENRESAGPIVLAGADKLPSLSKTALKAKLRNTPFTLADKTATQTIWVLHNKSKWEEIEPVILAEKPFVTEEQLTEYLHTLETPYLLETDNHELSGNVVRLLISEEEDNLMLAFEMIQTGGATVAIQSMIAALALKHSSDVIHKKARQLYIKVGNPAFVPLMRKSFYKYTDYTLRLSRHEAISPTDFMVMIDYLAYMTSRRHFNHQKSYFRLYWQRLGIRTLTTHLPYFADIELAFLGENPDMDIQQVVDILAQLPKLYLLDLSGCKLRIPASITRLQSLTTLNLAGCQMDDFSILREMKNLNCLYLTGCKVKNWDWLSDLLSLTLVNVSKADENKIPHLRKEMADGKPFLRLR